MLVKKMIRDIKSNLSQFIAIFLMVMIGVMAYTGIEAYMGGMQHTADKFYSENNLFDLVSIGENFTDEDLEKVKALDNVKDAERKLSVNAKTDDDKVLLLSFIESNNISKFYVKEGIPFDINKSGVWLDEYYAKKNKIKVGDTISVKYDTLNLKEKVLGLINVPDHLYDTKDESELYPNRDSFGFAYLSINEITEDYIKSKVMSKLNIKDEALFNKYVKNFNYKDYLVFNYLMIDVDEKDNIDKVKADIEENISASSLVLPATKTTSYVTYQGEIDEGKTYVGVFSGLFIFIALLSVITTMTRVVKKQKVQIGTLKALGFSDFKILIHYLSYGFTVSLAGCLVGLILGYFFIGNVFIALEMSFFEIPNGAPLMNATSYLVSILVIFLVVLITYLTVRSILKECPADTLRNEIPKVKKGSLNLTKGKLINKLSFSSKWNLRDILRNKMRTLMGLAGIIGCTVLIVCALGMKDSLNHFVELQFGDLYNFDYKLTLNDDISDKNLESLTQDYGNESSLSLSIEIIKDGKKTSNNVLVNNSTSLLRFVDKKGKFMNIDKNDGVYITYKLAEIEGYKLGDKIKWHIAGDDEEYTSTIVGFNKDPQNQNMTMTKEYYESLGKTYKPNTIYTNKKIDKSASIDGVNLIQDKNALKESMNNMLSMMQTMISLIIFIAVILGVIIIYNLSILSYSEKQYQFATLKVLGFEDKKIRNIFIKQNNWITILSIIIGLPLGYVLVEYLFQVAIEEHYDFNAYIKPLTYIISAVFTFVVSYIVSTHVSKKIKNIDMVSSLKGNE